jgi:hypothetical protein
LITWCYELATSLHHDKHYSLEKYASLNLLIRCISRKSPKITNNKSLIASLMEQVENSMEVALIDAPEVREIACGFYHVGHPTVVLVG